MRDVSILKGPMDYIGFDWFFKSCLSFLLTNYRWNFEPQALKPWPVTGPFPELVVLKADKEPGARFFALTMYQVVLDMKTVWEAQEKVKNFSSVGKYIQDGNGVLSRAHWA